MAFIPRVCLLVLIYFDFLTNDGGELVLSRSWKAEAQPLLLISASVTDVLCDFLPDLLSTRHLCQRRYGAESESLAGF